MRIILRVGLIVGAIGLGALYALQIAAALFVAPAIVALGVVVGLCMAKWLPRSWYGRQFAAGGRAGAIACGLAAVGAALFLLLQGPHTLAALTARSHLGPLSLAPAIAPFAYLGWAGLDVGAALVALIVGILAAGLTTQIVAASKSRRALRVVEQARLVAQSLNRSDAWAAPVSGGRATSGPGLYGAAANPTGGPALGPSLSALWPTAAPPSGTLMPPSASFGASAPSSMSPTGAMPAFPSAAAAGASWGAGVNSVPLGRATQAPAPVPAPASSSASNVAGVPGASFGGAGLTALPPTPPPPLTQQPKGARWAESNPPQSPAASATANGAPGVSRTPSSARAADSALTEEQRQALATWANDPSFATRQPRAKRTEVAPANAGGAGSAPTDPNAPATPPEVTAGAAAAAGDADADDSGRHRPANPSTYLNSNPPAKRVRKKQNTRDWLC